MPVIHPTNHKRITARYFPDEGFREADSESVGSEKDNKRFETEFSRVYELTAGLCASCLVPGSSEYTKDFFERIH